MAQFYTNFRNESVGGAPSELSILFGASDITMTTQTGNILAESDVSVLMSPSAGNTYARAAVQVGGVTTSGETTVRLLAQWQRATPAAVGSIVGGSLAVQVTTQVELVTINGTAEITQYPSMTTEPIPP